MIKKVEYTIVTHHDTLLDRRTGELDTGIYNYPGLHWLLIIYCGAGKGDELERKKLKIPKKVFTCPAHRFWAKNNKQK